MRDLKMILKLTLWSGADLAAENVCVMYLSMRSLSPNTNRHKEVEIIIKMK